MTTSQKATKSGDKDVTAVSLENHIQLVVFKPFCLLYQMFESLKQYVPSVDGSRYRACPCEKKAIELTSDLEK